MSDQPNDAEAAGGGTAAGGAQSDASSGLSREEVFSWLSGPRAAAEQAGTTYGYRGERLGLPRSGAGAVASFGRRLAAVFVDWVAALLVARGIESAFLEPTTVTHTFLPVLVFFLEVALLTMVSGSSFGQRLLGLTVLGLDGGAVSPVRVVMRTALLCLAVPALIWDRDGRGLHDKAARSVVLSRR